MRRPWLLPTDCTGQSACIPRRVPGRRSGCSCRDHSHSRDHHNTQRCSRHPCTHLLRCGSSSTDRRRRNRCQRRLSFRQSDCTGKMRCIGRRERDRLTWSPMRCRHRCRSRRRDWHSTGCRSNRRHHCCGSNCARRRRKYHCWHRRPTHRSGYIRSSTCIRSRASARRCCRRHRTRR